MTKQEILDRIRLLAGEIDANEEENRVMQEEINSLYAKIDAGDYDADKGYVSGMDEAACILSNCTTRVFMPLSQREGKGL